MLAWAYNVPSWMLALRIIFFFEIVSLGGLFFARRFILPRLNLHGDVNEAVGGIISAIGVFYGVTVGLIAVGVWNNYANASALTTFEPTTDGQRVLHAETLNTFNQLVSDRRLRVDAVANSLSSVMWFVIWIGQRGAARFHGARDVD